MQLRFGIPTSRSALRTWLATVISLMMRHHLDLDV